MKKQKFYVVWKGRRTGIFTTWEQAFAQVNGFAGAQYKSFDTRAEAERAWERGHVARESRIECGAKPVERWKQLRLLGVEPPQLPSYCADAACGGNPGVLEYRCVETETGKEIFARGPFPQGTNNIGEFLGIVETLMLLRGRNEASPVYSDSRNAIVWVAAKQCKTQLTRNRRNAKLFQRIADAEEWLRENKYPNKILKWRTEEWGENPADYGRK
ncbi:MAG: ribonuclease H family protein [Chloroflexi bacterium]|nr:ribonuclease H family protein [Chloroflexota bacterium]